jgi:hypothetical protein
MPFVCSDGTVFINGGILGAQVMLERLLFAIREGQGSFDLS